MKGSQRRKLTELWTVTRAKRNGIFCALLYVSCDVRERERESVCVCGFSVSLLC